MTSDEALGRWNSPASPCPVTVIVAASGSGLGVSIRDFVRSMSRQTMRPEIIIAEQAVPGQKCYAGIADCEGIVHVSSYPERGPRGELYFCKGRAYNVGCSLARGEFVMLTDPDLLFCDRQYLARCVRLLRASHDAYIHRPRMLHYRSENWLEFADEVAREGWVADTALIGDYPWMCKWSDGKLVPSEESRMLVQGGDTYVAPVAKLTAYRRSPEQYVKPPWEPTQHEGTVICSRRLLNAAEGVCEHYLVWGFEDLDLKWKLNSLATPLNPDELVVHRDHARPYLESVVYERNRYLYQLRQERGHSNAIRADAGDTQSFWGAFRDQRWAEAADFLT